MKDTGMDNDTFQTHCSWCRDYPLSLSQLLAQATTTQNTPNIVRNQQSFILFMISSFTMRHTDSGLLDHFSTAFSISLSVNWTTFLYDVGVLWRYLHPIAAATQTTANTTTKHQISNAVTFTI